MVKWKPALEGVVMIDRAFWQNRRVLVTGHTGFKGSWLTLWLRGLGAEVCGIALPPSTHPNLFDLAKVGEGIDSSIQDIRDAEETLAVIRCYAPEIVFHLAAQPLVRASYRKPLETFATNIMGTAHLLEALRGLRYCARGNLNHDRQSVLQSRAPLPLP